MASSSLVASSRHQISRRGVKGERLGVDEVFRGAESPGALDCRGEDAGVVLHKDDSRCQRACSSSKLFESYSPAMGQRSMTRVALTRVAPP